MKWPLALCLVAWGAAASAQTVVGDRIQLASGPCTLRSGSGAPAGATGAVCDTYFRTDSPYTVYVKTGASTWTATVIMPASAAAGDLVTAASASTLSRIAAVASGQVLASNGTSAPPVYTASPSVTLLTATGTGHSIDVTNTNPGMWITETDGAADNQKWAWRAVGENLALRSVNDVENNFGTILSFDRTGITPDTMTVGVTNTLPSTGYVTNLGSLQKKFLTLHAAELWVETLVAQNTIATIGGRILVGPTTTLVADFASGATTINVKHNQMVSGDRVYMEADGKVEFMAVTSGASGSAGNYTYSVTRNLDGTGANDWYAGDAVFNTGTTGDGYIDLYSVSGVNAASTAGPTIVGNVRTGTTYSNLAPRWAIGNLNGIAGYGADTYGAFFGDASATNVTVDATNGFRIRNSTTNKFVADTSGNLSIVGDLSVGTAGVIRSGSTSYASGTGYVLDYNAGTPRLRVGTTAGNRLAWDGTDLTLVSANATIGASGVSITPSTTTSTARSYGFTVATGSLGLFGTDAGGVDLGRSAFLQSEWTGVGDYPNDVHAYLRARHYKSGGTDRDTYVKLRSSESGGSIFMQATNGVVQMNTTLVQTDATFNTISGGQLSLGTRVQFINNAGVEVGGVGKSSTDGLTLRAVSGSTRDFTIQDTAGTAVLGIVGSEIAFAGVASDGTGKVVCIKSDATIGTCSAASINTSSCTCS